jgi:ribosomal protein S18 acetylase RimI-like enzyme
LPQYRRRGVGGGLVQRLIAEAKERGAAYALLYSAAEDIRGVLGFYERHHFRSWYVRMFRAL